MSSAVLRRASAAVKQCREDGKVFDDEIARAVITVLRDSENEVFNGHPRFTKEVWRTVIDNILR
jgi:hypothetical protein